jgi:hypothetical protein
MHAPIDLIRKTAAVEQGEKYLEERFGHKTFSPLSTLGLKKAASAADPSLLRIAAQLSEGGDTLEMYELLGGKYEQ